MIPNLIVNYRCPSCRSYNIAPVDPFPVQQVSDGIFPSEYQVFSCNKCSLWFKDRFPDNEAIQQHYDKLELAEDLWDYKQRLPHEKKLDKVLRELPKRAKVLDVGCWTGRLLEVHTHLERCGIEPNPESAAVAAQKGINILGTSATEETLRSNTFDVITMIDVFEHLSSPTETIKLLVRQLRPNGRLIIVTGRTDSFPVKLVRSTYWYFSIVPDHIVFLNKRFVTKLKERLGLRSVKATAVTHYPFHLKKHLKELAWLLIWRFANPNSPFRSGLSRLLLFKSFARLRDTIICTTWRDHYYIVFEKTSKRYY